jgi:hypothetical protein
VRSNRAPVALQLIGGGIDCEEGTSAHRCRLSLWWWYTCKSASD